MPRIVLQGNVGFNAADAETEQPLADRVLLSDPVLESEKICRPAAGHDNHAHWEIRPPVRKDD